MLYKSNVDFNHLSPNASSKMGTYKALETLLLHNPILPLVILDIAHERKLDEDGDIVVHEGRKKSKRHLHDCMVSKRVWELVFQWLC